MLRRAVAMFRPKPYSGYCFAQAAISRFSVTLTMKCAVVNPLGQGGFGIITQAANILQNSGPLVVQLGQSILWVFITSR